MASKNCQICGKPSGIYPLCSEHMQEKSKGNIIKCENCGTWHWANEECKCKRTQKYIELPIEGFSNCVICNTKTKGYAFCKKCYKEHTEQEMLDILNNQINHVQDINNINKNAEEQNNDNDLEINKKTYKPITINPENKSKCIVCGRQTDGLLFCQNCYKKYKNKSLLFKITNCSEVEMLDESYEGIHTCPDGHVVKSKSELYIDQYLFKEHIPHAYETKLFYGRTEKEYITPDFFLPNYLGKDKHVYIEHWGLNENNIQYQKTKKFKIEKYKQMKKTLICIFEKDFNHIEENLERKLNKENIYENEINFDEE